MAYFKDLFKIHFDIIRVHPCSTSASIGPYSMSSPSSVRWPWDVRGSNLNAVTGRVSTPGKDKCFSVSNARRMLDSWTRVTPLRMITWVLEKSPSYKRNDNAATSPQNISGQLARTQFLISTTLWHEPSGNNNNLCCIKPSLVGTQWYCGPRYLRTFLLVIFSFFAVFDGKKDT